MEKAHPIELFGRDRALSIIYSCLLGLILPMGLLLVIIRFHIVDTIALIVLIVLFFLPFWGYLINVPRMKKEEMDRLELCVDHKGFYYLNPFSGKTLFFNWSEIETIHPVLFYNYERRLEIVTIKEKNKKKRIHINLSDYSYRFNGYSLKRTVIHYSGRSDIWKSKGPLFLW